MNDLIETTCEVDGYMRTMLDANPHINILFDSNFKVVDCNPAAMTFMGFATKEEFVAGFVERMTQSIPKFQSDGRPSHTVAGRLMTAAKEGVARFESNIVLNDIKRNLDIELKRIPYEKNFAIVAYVFDMTGVRERERELILARKQNELQLTKLNLVVQATKIGLWEMIIVKDDPLSPENSFIWSDEFRHLLGFSNEIDFPNVVHSWSTRLHPEDKGETLDRFKEHLFDRTGQTPFDTEYRLLKKNGEYGYYRTSGESLRDKNGNALHVAGALMDITETKNILLDTENQRIAAEAASKAKTDFLSKMSHEIRTPMNAILGITEIQLQNASLPSETKEALGKIYNAGDLLLGIINDILDLSRIEAGKLELASAKYDVASLVNDVVTLNMMRIGSKRIEFKLSVDENMPSTLLGDELRIKQVLNNVLSNAIKYTIKGTVELSVFAEVKEDFDVALFFEVRDTGLGMTEEQVGQLFDEYSRFNMEANRTTEGTGLGMSITRNLLRLMGGDIFVKSTINVGSVFTIQLPQKRIDSAVLGKELAKNLQNFRANGMKQVRMAQVIFEQMPDARILLVDDVESNLYVATGLLAPYGVSMDTVTSGYAAIDKIKEGNEYDIIFMDHMMPGMDGIETTRIIREMGYELPIVALTANAVSGQSGIFLANGFDSFVSKPIDVRQLNAVLKKFIRDKRSSETDEPVEQKAEVSQPSETGIDPRLAEIFVRDAAKSIAALDAIEEKGVCDEDDRRMYIIHTHGMKSALANIGRMELSAVALKLEAAGRDGNTEIISTETTAFLDALKKLVKELAPTEETDGDGTTNEDRPLLRKSLLAIKTACDEYDEKSVEGIMVKLREKTWSGPTKKLLNTIAEHLLHSDFDEIADAVDKFMRSAF